MYFYFFHIENEMKIQQHYVSLMAEFALDLNIYRLNEILLEQNLWREVDICHFSVFLNSKKKNGFIASIKRIKSNVFALQGT